MEKIENISLKEEFWKDGNIFRMSTGEYRMVCGNTLIDSRGFIPKYKINESLYCTDSTIDKCVIEVYPPRENVGYLGEFIMPDKNPIWRKPSHIISMEDIKKKLGIPYNEELLIVG